MLTRIERVTRLKAINSKARRRAPIHPVKPEKRLRKTVRVLLKEYHARLVFLLVAASRQRILAVADDPAKASALRSAAHYGNYLRDTSSFKPEVKGAAADTATSAKKQTARALGRPVTADLSKQEERFAQSTFDKTEEEMAQSIERAEAIYDAWDESDEDEEELQARLDEGLDGITGSALAAASLYFGYEFGQMIKEAQTDSGVSEYTWIAQRDSATRPAHAALDGETAQWDDPPLSGDVSDNEEDDHPGEDYNCRCVASPIDPEESEPN